MPAKTAIKTTAKICPASFFTGSIIRISSLIPTKNTINNPAKMYFSSNLKYVPAKITVESTSPTKTAIPPRVGMELKCDVLLLGVAQRSFNLEIFTIDGTVIQVMENAIKNPRRISVQLGIKMEKTVAGKYTIRGFSWLSD